jgi:uncharacterized protein with FMN-binding domain
MRRAVPVIAATAGSLALLANFHTTPSSTATVGSTVDPGLAGDAPTTISPPPTSSTPPPPRTSPTTAPTTRTVDGTDVFTRYGDVQVRITLSGTRIVDVQAIRLPSSHRRSVEISQGAEPRLRQEALQAQTAQIDVVSGASYTSIGYAQSLQGALDRAG